MRGVFIDRRSPRLVPRRVTDTSPRPPYSPSPLSSSNLQPPTNILTSPPPSSPLPFPPPPIPSSSPLPLFLTPSTCRAFPSQLDRYLHDFFSCPHSALAWQFYILRPQLPLFSPPLHPPSPSLLSELACWLPPLPYRRSPAPQLPLPHHLAYSLSIPNALSSLSTSPLASTTSSPSPPSSITRLSRPPSGVGQLIEFLFEKGNPPRLRQLVSVARDRRGKERRCLMCRGVRYRIGKGVATS